MESTTIGRARQRTAPAGPRRRTRAAVPPPPRSTRPAAAPGAPPRVRRPARVTPLPLRRNAAVPRAPFVLLVLSLLGGGLICLLVINTTLGATSFEIDHLQHAADAKVLQAQQLQNQLASDESDAKIKQEACSLGMRPPDRLEFLDLGTHRLRASTSAAGSTSAAASPAWCPR